MTCFEEKKTGWVLPGGHVFFFQTLAIHFSIVIFEGVYFKIIPMSNFCCKSYPVHIMDLLLSFLSSSSASFACNSKDELDGSWHTFVELRSTTVLRRQNNLY